MIEGVEGRLADTDVGRKDGDVGLVEKFIDAALVGFSVHEDAAQGKVSAQLLHIIVTCYPLVS